MITNVTRNIDFQREYKLKHFDEMTVVMFFRVSDSYETYEDDAETVSQICGWEVCNDAENQCKKITFERKSLDWVLPKIIRRGMRVAIVDQM